MIRYRSSYRAVSIGEALKRARPVASRLGISRVTDITLLDRIGVPVFASVRPGAARGSLCVNAGKGLTAREARIGAYMEAIEFAYAERGTARVQTRLARAREVLDGRTRRDAILDLCPIFGVAIPLDAKIECVKAESVRGTDALVPAELVFYPYERSHSKMYFGSCTNGLASGATLVEATVHGLFEVIERDIASFVRLGRTSLQVQPESMPALHQRIVAHLNELGFSLAVRWLPNAYGVACFHAVLWESGALDPIYVTEGYGCHLDPTIALTRAITEACQSRLTYIHGARDDIDNRYALFEGWSATRMRAYAKKLLAAARKGTTFFDFRSAPNGAAGAQSLHDLLARLCDSLAGAGMKQVLRVKLTPDDARLHVVRIIVPRLEFFSSNLPRLGLRLSEFASSA